MRSVCITGMLLFLWSAPILTPEEVPVPRRLVVSIPDRKLAVLEGSNIVREYPIAVGKPATPTPTGRFQVGNREEYPECRADWPYGTRWIEFLRKRAGRILFLYGIHGTNVPRSVGAATSHGCIRLHNNDVEDLYRFTYPGQPVQITGEHLRRVASEPAG